MVLEAIGTIRGGFCNSCRVYSCIGGDRVSNIEGWEEELEDPDKLTLINPLNIAGARFRLAVKSVFLIYPRCTLAEKRFI